MPTPWLRSSSPWGTASRSSACRTRRGTARRPSRPASAPPASCSAPPDRSGRLRDRPHTDRGPQPVPGLTVMISLAGLFLVQSQTIRSMAIGAIVVVAVSVLAAVTLLPALLRLLGHRAYARGRIAILGGLVFRRFRARPRR